jgi:hypothetical protein
MQVTNVNLYKDFSFDSYLALPGYSYSSFKKGNFTPTEKMKLGTSVHQFMLEPSKYNHENRDVIYPIANVLIKDLGPMLPFLDAELSVTCDFEHDGYVMPYRGRVDLVRMGSLVIDLKISEIPLNRSIDFFGYAEQLTGYCLAMGCDTGMIIRACPKTFKTEKVTIRKNVQWWERKVIQHGEWNIDNIIKF